MIASSLHLAPETNHTATSQWPVLKLDVARHHEQKKLVLRAMTMSELWANQPNMQESPACIRYSLPGYAMIVGLVF
jgi:hypothetical protein